MSDPAKQISYLAAALKAPRIGEAATRLAGQARDAGWTHEDYLIAVLDREVAARNASGAQLRIRDLGLGRRAHLMRTAMRPRTGGPANPMMRRPGLASRRQHLAGQSTLRTKAGGHDLPTLPHGDLGKP